MRRVEAAHQGRDIRLLLIALYNELGSQQAVAEALGVSQATVDNWLSSLNIGTAAFPEAWLNRSKR
jgi:predicted transcriptional regulator